MFTSLHVAVLLTALLAWKPSHKEGAEIWTLPRFGDPSSTDRAIIHNRESIRAF